MASTQLTVDRTGASSSRPAGRSGRVPGRGAGRATRTAVAAAPTTSAAQPPEDRLLRWALWVFFALLPLQWFLIPGVPQGAQRLHLLGIVGFTVFMLVRYKPHTLVPVLRVALPVLYAGAVFVAVWAGANIYHFKGIRSPLQEAVQLVAIVAVGAAVYRAATYPSTRVLEAARWTALVAGVSVLLALSVSMASNGVNPAATFGQTIAQGDPEILQRELFRSAFAGYGLDEDSVKGNIRHEVFGAVLTAMCLSSAAARLRPFSRVGAARVYRLSMALGAGLVVVSLSRSDMLAGVVWVALAVLTQARRFGITNRQLAVVSAAVLAIGGAVASGFASVLYVRFTQDTSSYEARDRLFGESIAAIPDHFWTGGIEPAGASSHMFIIDSTLRAGVLGGLSALVIVVLVLALFVQLAWRLPTEPSFMLPVTAALALPLIRFFTAGGGVIPPVQYIGLGIVAGFVAYRLTLSRTGRSPETGARRSSRR